MRLTFGRPRRRKLTPAEKELLKAYGSELEEKLWGQMGQRGVQDLFYRQYSFIKGRKFLADFAAPRYHLIVEVDGGIWKKGGGGHNTGAGYERDRERDAVSLLNGWRVLRVTSGMIDDGRAIDTIVALVKHLPCTKEGL